MTVVSSPSATWWWIHYSRGAWHTSSNSRFLLRGNDPAFKESPTAIDVLPRIAKGPLRAIKGPSLKGGLRQIKTQMKWTVNNYSHKSNCLSYYRSQVCTLSFAPNKHSVIWRLHLMPFETSYTINPHLSDSQVGGRLRAASFIFNHGQLAHGEWWVFRWMWLKTNCWSIQRLMSQFCHFRFESIHCKLMLCDGSVWVLPLWSTQISESWQLPDFLFTRRLITLLLHCFKANCCLVAFADYWETSPCSWGHFVNLMTRSANVGIFGVLCFTETSHLERDNVLIGSPCKQQPCCHSRCFTKGQEQSHRPLPCRPVQW